MALIVSFCWIDLHELSNRDIPGVNAYISFAMHLMSLGEMFSSQKLQLYSPVLTKKNRE